ncbi:unnamed protein product, partial [Owenia fusiformis]
QDEQGWKKWDGAVRMYNPIFQHTTLSQRVRLIYFSNNRQRMYGMENVDGNSRKDADSKDNLNIKENTNDLKHDNANDSIDLKQSRVDDTDLTETVRQAKNKTEEHKCECDCCRQQGKSVTIVTGLFDIGRKRWSSFKRTYHDYLNFAQNVLKLDVNLVFYVEERGRYFVEKHRRGKEHKTEVIVTEWKNLTFYRYLTAIETIMGSKEFKLNNRLLNHPEGFSALYNLLMSSKFSIMYETTLRNTFHSDYFFWMDAGYGHGNSSIFPPENCPWAPCNILTDMISYINLYPTDVYKPAINRLYKMSVAPALNGGFFGGSKNAIHTYHKLYKAVLEDWLKNGRIDDDQTMALACYFKKPNLFNLVPGGWNDVFKLFN